MTTGASPYVVPDATLTTFAPGVFETELTAAETTVNIGGDIVGGITAHAETFNGAIPGPTIRLNVGDSLIVRLINNLPHPTGIHWHGIELENAADGTPFTQDGVPGAPLQVLGNGVPAGGTFLYKFKVTRPGLYWYHPHHHSSTNQVLRGLYGMIVVRDPNEATLIANGVLPSLANTRQLVLSDITVCKAVGANDPQTYNTMLPWPWAGGPTLPAQPGPTPATLCELPTALDEEGNPAAASFGAGDVPNIQQLMGGRTNEGQIVLTNGVNVGGRAGSPTSPGLLTATAQTLDVLPGQGLRLQIVNTATIRYFRLLLTTSTGAPLQLVRVGGEGELLDNAVVEGGMIGAFDTKYALGEILIPPASRADVVAVMPGVAGVLTLWTQDYARTGSGAGFTNIPTVPVMHLNVTGAATTYMIGGGTALRASIPGAAVEVLPAPGPGMALLDRAAFMPAKPGMTNPEIRLTQLPGNMLAIDDVMGTHDVVGPYAGAPHLDSSRYGKQGDVLELTVRNTTGAHHPFHLHGFSMQPISLTNGVTTFTWPYAEFRDNIDIPGGYTLRFRIRLDDRPLADGVTLGGAFGRWLFHCHIFFHAHLGMIGELVVTAADGSEKPNVNVGGSWEYAAVGDTATRQGRFSHPDSDPMTLMASKGTVVPAGPAAGGAWSWSFTSAPGDPPSTEYVYITATDPAGRKDQAVFRLKIGAPDDGADTGDPHIRTVDGKHYDFQSAGEFTLLFDHDGMEVQARQTPVLTATPITDAYSGLTACVSLNTAVAVRVGAHRIAYQPGRDAGQLQFHLDGKPARLPVEGIDLERHRVSPFDAGGATGLRVDYAHHAVVTVTPNFWTSHGLWYLNVAVSHTQADEGIMGAIPAGTWLPRLPSGATVGPMPASLGERYVALYRTFANAWRVTDATSLFVYAPGTSTATFTDEDWPAEKPPCRLKPQFVIPGVPTPVNIGIERARQVCQGVTEDDLHKDCVFDVATMGDETIAKAYVLAQELRLCGSAVQVVGDKVSTRPGEPLVVTATVSPLHGGGPTPAGSVTFLVDGVAAGPPVQLDEKGRARFTADRLSPGAHRIRAAYTSEGGERRYHASSSPNLLHTVEEGPGSAGGSGFGCRPITWIWIVLVVLVIAALVYFS